jgi:hypothetical protein
LAIAWKYFIGDGHDFIGVYQRYYMHTMFYFRFVLAPIFTIYTFLPSVLWVFNFA